MAGKMEKVTGELMEDELMNVTGGVTAEDDTEEKACEICGKVMGRKEYILHMYLCKPAVPAGELTSSKNKMTAQRLEPNSDK